MPRPKTLQQLRDERVSVVDDMEALLSTAKDEDRDLTDDERTQFDSLEAKATSLNDQIEARQADDRRVAALATHQDELEPAPRQTQASTVPAEVRQPKWSCLGEFMSAVHSAAVPGQVRDPRLSTLAATGASEAVPSDGGFLVEREQVDRLFEKMFETGSLLSRVSRQAVGPNSNGVKIPYVDETSRANGSRFGGIRAYWAAEAAQMTSSKPTFGVLDLVLHKLTGLFYATDELLQDTSALESFVSRTFPLEMRFKAEDSLINGTGAGQPEGILNATATVSVAAETGQSASTIVKENIDKMYARMWAPSRQNAVWLINQDVEPQLFKLEATVGTGGVPVFLPPSGNISGAPFGSIYGIPILPIEYCATLGTVGDIILADMSQYVLAEKGGMQSASSIHLRFDYNETAFRWTWRLDARPIWNSALTPFKGSNTQSPFITLATRS